MIRWSHDSEFARLLDSNPAYPKNREYVGPVAGGESESIDAFTFAIRLPDDDGLLGFVEISGIEWTH